MQKIKYNIPSLIRAINSAEDDIRRTYYYNMLLCLLASVFLFISLVLNTVFGLIFNEKISLITMDSIILFFLGMCFAVLVRTIKGNKEEIHIISALYCGFFIYFLIRFYSSVGPLVWIIGVTNIVLSVLHYTRIMIVYTSAIMISTSIYFNSIQSSNYSINSIIQVAILCYFFLAIIVIYKIKFWSDQIAMEKRLGTICEPKMTDELTGLPNRTYFCDKIRQDLLTSIRGENAYFLFIDIDQFKVINDTMGHSAGDLLINSVSSRLTKILRENDGITRYGGDEFLIVLRNLKDTENVNEISERILHSIREPFYINHYSVNVTCSIGVSSFPTDGKNIEMLIKKADDAMYTAKNEGKNRCVLYSKNLDKSIQLKNIRIDLLQQALKRNEFELYYQPQVHINTKKIIGTEGFIRWHNPEKGILYPKDFIPLAEKSGLINEISEWVLQAACKQNKYWQEKGILNAPVAVNLSMVEINGTLLRRVSDTLNRTALDPKYLELEIPERLLLNNISEVKGNIEQLKKLGVKLTIGNFGAEYLPFNLLKQFPIDRIKIPINYIYGNEQDSEKERYISMILGVVQNLGFEVIAQGVETQKQMDFLKTQFCQSVQGYHICWPMRANEIEGFFLTKKFIYASTVK